MTMNSHSIRSECLLPKVRASDYKSLKNDDTVDEEEDLDSSINSESTSSTGIYGSDAIGNDSVEEKTAITLSLGK